MANKKRIARHFPGFHEPILIETYHRPRSCMFYQAVPARKVRGRKGMSYPEEDWIDDKVELEVTARFDFLLQILIPREGPAKRYEATRVLFPDFNTIKQMP